jgi:hypothetical protein
MGGRCVSHPGIGYSSPRCSSHCRARGFDACGSWFGRTQCCTGIASRYAIGTPGALRPAAWRRQRRERVLAAVTTASAPGARRGVRTPAQPPDRSECLHASKITSWPLARSSALLAQKGQHPSAATVMRPTPSARATTRASPRLRSTEPLRRHRHAAPSRHPAIPSGSAAVGCPTGVAGAAGSRRDAADEIARTPAMTA